MAVRRFLAEGDPAHQFFRDDGALCLETTGKFSVLSAAPPEYDDGLPRVAYGDVFGPKAGSAGAAALVRALETFGFVVVTGVGEGAQRYRCLEAALMGDFFASGDFGAAGSSKKARCVGEVYENEREVPMWRCGYEFVEDRVREAFRRHAKEHSLVWPSARAKAAWHRLASFCEGMLDEALAMALQSPGHPESFKEAERAAHKEAIARCRREGGDFSVAYSLHYPNDVQLPASVAGEEGILVKAHVDPSLLVVEPVCDVPGLDVFDPSTEAWVSIERASKTPASEFVVFGGRCLEAVTKGRIKACLHRVTSSDYGHAASRPGEENEGRRAPPRFCFIFEQKLGDFFEAA